VLIIAIGISYNRFLELKSYVIPILAVYMKHKSGAETGMYYIDSTTLKVCRNQRIHRHKVFNKIASRGKSSMGWFFGFKLHLVINHKGEIMSFCLTPGNIDDRKPMETLFKNLQGTACGDKGYIGSSAFLMGKFMQSSRNPLNPSKVFEKATHY
jgi:hypothetical protein